MKLSNGVTLMEGGVNVSMTLSILNSVGDAPKSTVGVLHNRAPKHGYHTYYETTAFTARKPQKNKYKAPLEYSCNSSVSNK